MKLNYLWGFILLLHSFSQAQQFDYLSPTTGEIETYSSIEDFNKVYESKPSTKFVSKNTLTTLSSCTLTAPIESQAEINALSGCTSIDGSLIIRGSNITDGPETITDLNPLNSITSISEFFEISGLTSLTEFPSFINLTQIGSNFGIANLPGLTTLPSFPNLSSVGGSLSIQGLSFTSLVEFPNLTSVGSLTILANSEITSIDGFNALTSVENVISIQSNANLEEINGFNSLTSAGTFIYAFNHNTTELNGFDNIISLDRLVIAIINQSFDITAFSKLKTLGFLQMQGAQQDNIDFLSSVTELRYGMTIFNMPLLTNLNGLNNVVLQEGIAIPAGNTQINKNININSCAALTSLGTMDLTSTSHFPSISIVNTTNLTNASALSGVGGEINFVNISSTDVLNLDFLSNVSKITNNLNISNNSSLTDISGISSLDVSELESFQITNNNLLDECNIASVCEVVGLAADPTNNPDLNVIITNNNTNCASLSVVESACGICVPGSKFITNQAGIDNFACTVVDGDLYIESQSIDNLNALSIITEITGTLRIGDTNITSLDGLQNITSIGDNIEIFNNPLLTNLDGLSNVTSALGDFLNLFNNTSLTDISGVANIDVNSSNSLFITNNTSLAECEIASVCSLLDLNANNVTIQNNATGCNTKAEVQDACQALVPQCPPGNVTLSSQAEVDAFAAEYPNCTEIENTLTIEGSSVINIDFLGNLERVGNDLIIENTSLTSLDIFNSLVSASNIKILNNSQLVSIGGFSDVVLNEGSLTIEGNNSLTSIFGFGSLVNVFELKLSGTSLSNISGLSNLTKAAVLDIRNTVLTNLSSLNGLKLEQTSTDIRPTLIIASNTELISIDGLTLQSEMEFISITANQLLQSLIGLEDVRFGNIFMANNEALTDLTGLNNLEASYSRPSQTNPVALTIFGNNNLLNLNALSNYVDAKDKNITIRSNQNLTDISGLDNLVASTVDLLTIRGNPNLAACSSVFVCGFLTNNASNATISQNAAGCASVAEVQAACQALAPQCPTGSVVLANQAEVDAFVAQYPNCTEINGSLSVNGEDSSITSLEGLVNLETITGTLSLLSTDVQNLDDLANLTGTLNNVGIANNSLLNDLSGLGGITQVNRLFNVIGNPMLENLDGLNLTNIGSGVSDAELESQLVLDVSGNAGMTSLNGLESLVSLNNRGLSISNNAQLTDITAIENIDPDTVGGIYILGNASLSMCNIDLLCNFGSLDEDNQVLIENNAAGCASVAEVQAACQPLSINEFTTNDIKVYPNPFADHIEVQLPAGVQNAEVKLMSLTGKVLHSSRLNSSNAVIKDVAQLNSGLYLLQVELETGQKLTFKIIK